LLNTQDLDGNIPGYEIHTDEQTGQDFFISEVGVYVKVTVGIGNIEHTVNLAVTDGTNRAMKIEPYTYKVKYGSKEYEKIVAGVTVVDIQNTQQRALTKGIALHGLGLSLWTGDDFDSNEPVVTTTIPRATPPAPRASANEPVKTDNLKKKLEEGNDYWGSVVKATKASKQQWAVVQKKILQKYTVESEVLAKLKSIYNESRSK